MTGRGKLVSCLSFGNLLRFASCTFNGCSNLISVPNQIPRTFTSLNSMFTSCSSFNDSNVCSWDTSNIDNMTSTFSLASSFNRPLNSWNTSKVTVMNSMFGQSPFNQPLGSWNTSKVTNMSLMFNQQTAGRAFNQDINQWNVGNVTNMSQMFYINKGMTYDLNSWDTSKVTTMQNMFYQSVFNGAVSNWNISAVQNIAGMFQQAPINQDISSWNFKGLNATANFDNFMNSVTSFSTSNYNALLIALNTYKSSSAPNNGPYRTDLRPNFGSSRYYGSTSAAATARAALITYGWTITDGGTTSTVPDAPTSVSGTSGNAQVSLTWTAPTYNNGAAISDYTIQYSSNSGSSWSTFSHTASATASITVTGLTNGTAYIFRVAAVNSAGTGSYSTNSSSVTPAASGGATFSSPNAAWTAIGFTGSGTSASPYTKATYSGGPAGDGAQITVVSTGTVRITCSNFNCDTDFVIYKNGTAAVTYFDNSGGNGFQGGTVNATISVNANDTIRLGNAGGSDYLGWGSALNIWWQ